MDEDDLLNTGEAADYLGLTAATLRNWRAGKNKQGPPTLKIGRYVRYRRGDLVRWARAQGIDDGGTP